MQFKKWILLLVALSSIYVIAFSQDGSILAGGGMGGIVRLWDIEGLNEK